MYIQYRVRRRHIWVTALQKPLAFDLLRPEQILTEIAKIPFVEMSLPTKNQVLKVLGYNQSN